MRNPCSSPSTRGHLMFCLLVLAVIQPMTIGSANAQDQPNIIVFLVDDLGWQDTSVAFSGDRTLFQAHFKTPNVVRLARRGVRMTCAYAHCVCSPTRTSIMTGQSPARHRVTNWTLFADRDQSGKTARLSAPSEWRTGGIQPADVTLPGLLRDAGYFTIHCGKAHWGAIGTAGSNPENLGFDRNIAGHSAGAPGSYQASENFGNHSDGSAKEPWGVPGLEKYYGTDAHLTDVLAIEATTAIEASVKQKKPFFLYMAPYAVHTPIQPHGRFAGNYLGRMYPGTEQAIPDVEAHYASMVQGYDAALGSILETITRLNVADRTLIVFTSDNGGLSAIARGTTPRGTGKDTHCWPLREGKGSAYEGGTRVPLIVSWATPDSGSSMQQKVAIRSDSVSSAHVISEDWLPTICNWAGVTLGQELIASLDGRDMTAWLTGDQEQNESRPLLFHYPHVWGPRGDGYQPHSSLRFGKWKVIYFYEPRRWELYDLQDDIGESRDLATTHPDQLSVMKKRLQDELATRHALYPVVTKTGKPQKPE